MRGGPMPGTYVPTIRTILTSDRFDAYREHQAESDWDLLARYAWNLGLGGALYSSLNLLEIGVRNRLDLAITGREGPTWYDDPDLVVEKAGQDAVAKVKATLVAESKTITPGRVVAGLDFGFWTGLLSSKYEQGWASTTGGQPPLLPVVGQRPLWPALMPVAFPGRTRKQLSGRLNDIRKLRNRVFHHEPIWRGLPLPNRNLKPLRQQHREILEAITWVSPDLHRTAILLDSFPEVYGAGPIAFRARLELLDA